MEELVGAHLIGLTAMTRPRLREERLLTRDLTDRMVVDQLGVIGAELFYPLRNLHE
jgi:hypothetical protein